MTWLITTGDTGLLIIRKRGLVEEVVEEVESMDVAMDRIAAIIRVGDIVKSSEGTYTVGPILKGLQ